MVGQAVQFLLHEWDQPLKRSFVVTAPIAEQLGDCFL